MQSISPHAHQIQPNLPVVQTSFIGCEPAIATIRELLSQTRLLTLTGSGGSGKTRLALSVAESVAASVTTPSKTGRTGGNNNITNGGTNGEQSTAAPASVICPDGVAWVDLAPLADPTL